MQMGAQGYSSDDSGSMKFSVQHFPIMPIDLTIKQTEESDLNTTQITTKTSAYVPRANSTVKDYFRGKKKTIPSNNRYNVKLSVQYETQIGEHIVVVGNIEQLGNWQDMTKCIMKWTDGHVWVTENLVTDRPYFLYKYVICRGGEAVTWEKGANRIADVEVLPDLTDTSKDPRISPSPSIASMSSKMSSISRKSGDERRRKSVSPTKSPVRNSLRHVQIEDEWEHFKIKFSINDPIEEQLVSGGDFMRIIGSIPKLGSKNAGEMESTPPMRMSRTFMPIEWLIDKYGQKMKPWEITIRFQMNELEQLPNEIIYSYSKSNDSATSIIKEREPSRSMIIQQPESYKGELGIQYSNQFKNQQKVWIVNGAIEKADANFLGSLYFDKIGDTGMSVGTYPLREDDVNKMKKSGISGILNLQTKKDIEQRGIPWINLKQIYEQQGIKCNRFPINDNDEDSLCASLFVAAQHLNNMINKEKLNVYLHCTSGISRAPAVALVYLCLFKRVKQWQNPQYVAQFVRAFHINSNPNMRAVNRVVEANLDFQSKQTDYQQELKIKQTRSEQSHGEEEFTGFYLPQQKPDEHRNSLSPQRLPSFKKRSSYGVRKTIPYIPSNRPVTPNIQKHNSNALLSDNSGSSNQLNFLGLAHSKNPSPQPFELFKSQSKVDTAIKPLEPMVNPFMDAFMAKDSQELGDDENKRSTKDSGNKNAYLDTPLRTTEIDTLNPDSKVSPSRTNKIVNDQEANTQHTPRFENRQPKHISSEKRSDGHQKQLFSDEQKPMKQSQEKQKSTPKKTSKAKNSGQKFMKVSQIDCIVRLDTSMAEFESQGGKEFFKDNLSKSLGISHSNIDIKSVREGSVIVDYSLTVDQDKQDEIQQLQQTKVNNGSIDFGFLMLDFKNKDHNTTLDESLLQTPPRRDQSHIDKTPEDIKNMSYADFTDVEQQQNFDDILELRETVPLQEVDEQKAVQNITVQETESDEEFEAQLNELAKNKEMARQEAEKETFIQKQAEEMALKREKFIQEQKDAVLQAEREEKMAAEAQIRQKQAQIDEEKRIQEDARAQAEKFRLEAINLKAQIEEERLQRQKEQEEWDLKVKREFEEIEQKRKQNELEAERQKLIDLEKRKILDAKAKADFEDQQYKLREELEKRMLVEHQAKLDQIAREAKEQEFQRQQQIEGQARQDLINAEKEALRIKQQEISTKQLADEESRLKKEVEERREQLQQIRAQKQFEKEQKEQAQKSSRLRDDELKRKQEEEAFFFRQKDIEQRAARSEFLRKKRQEAEEERLKRAKESKQLREQQQLEKEEEDRLAAQRRQEQLEVEKQAAFKIQKEKKEAELKRIHEEKVLAKKTRLDSPKKDRKSFRQYKTSQRIELKKEDEPQIETQTMNFKSTLKNFQTKNSYRSQIETDDDQRQNLSSRVVGQMNFEAEKRELLQQIENERYEKQRIEAETQQTVQFQLQKQEYERQQQLIEERHQEQRRILEQQQRQKVIQELQESQDMVNTQIAEQIISDMIKRQVAKIASETHQMLHIKEAQREQERLRIQKDERQRAEILKRQLLAEKKIEQDRIKQMAHKLEQEQEWLQQIAQENEIKRRAIEEESQKLREEEQSVRQMRLKQAEMMGEQQAEKQLLQKYNKQKEQKLELQKIQLQVDEDRKRAYDAQLQEEKCKKMKQDAEIQFEKERQIKIKNAQDELERLKNLRQEEEDKLSSIKQTYQEEQRIRKENIRQQTEELANRKEMNQYQAQIHQERLEEEAKFAAEAKYRSHNTYKQGMSPHRRDLSGHQISSTLNSGPRFSIPEQPTISASNRISLLNPNTQDSNASSSLVDSNIMTIVQSDVKGEDIEKCCDKIFGREAPIKFMMRKGNKLEEQIQKHIKKLKITIPIVWIRAQMYLVGTQRLSLENKFQAVMVRIGGGTERFDTYVPKNHRKFERLLVDYMSKSQQSLVWVIEKLMAGENIRKTINLPFSAKMVPNKHESSIKKVNLNLNSRNGSTDRSYESSASAKQRINFNNQIGNSANSRAYIPGSRQQSPTRNQVGAPRQSHLQSPQRVSNFNVFDNQRLPSPTSSDRQQDLEKNMFGRISPSRKAQPFGQNIFKKVSINLNESGNSRTSSASRSSNQMTGYLGGRNTTTWGQRTIE